MWGVQVQYSNEGGPEIRVILDLVAEWADVAGPGTPKRRLFGKLMSGGQLGLLLSPAGIRPVVCTVLLSKLRRGYGVLGYNWLSRGILGGK